MSGNEAPPTTEPSPSNPPIGSQRKHPCVLCQQRKIKCDRNEPCLHCKKAGVDCVSPPQYPPRKRKRRFPEAELLARIRRYEHHLKSYGADIDAINREDKTSSTESPVLKQTASSPVELLTGPMLLNGAHSLSIRKSLKHIENNLYVDEEFRDVEEILQGSSDDEMYEKPLTKTYDAMGPDTGDLLLATNPREPLVKLHPTPIQIFQLWQMFLDNVNALIHIFHAPTVQQRILDATTNLDQIPKNIEALMFGIYCMATVAMSESDCHQLFKETRAIVQARFQAGARLALQNACYLKSADLVVLQAFFLYLLSTMQMTVDPRSLFCLTGVAVRIAQRIGLSTDGTKYGLLPFEVEMRRRLWWNIVLMDIRAARVSGAGGMVMAYSSNTKFPSNINDSDLFPEMREPPAERAGVTDMIFLRIQCEEAEFRNLWASKLIGSLVTGSNISAIEKAIDQLEERFENGYLKHCDPSVPLHYMSIMSARSLICKVRMGSAGRHPHLLSKFALLEMSEDEIDRLILNSILQIEMFNLVMSNLQARRYIWHIHTNFPFPAHLYLIVALRKRTTGELVERAWAALAESDEHRSKDEHASSLHRIKMRESSLHYALANLAVKAWEAREAAFQQPIPTPPYISGLRQLLAARKGRSPASSSDDSMAQLRQIEASFPEQLGDWFDPNSFSGGQAFNQPFVPMDVSSPGWGLWGGMMQGNQQMPMQGFNGMFPYGSQ